MKRVFFLLNAACVLEILDSIFRARHASFVTTLPKQPKYFSLLQLFVIYHYLYLEGYFEILINLAFFLVVSIPQHFPISVDPSFMPSITVTSS